MVNPPTDPAALVDRRGFLRGVAGGGAAIAVASLVPAGCAPDYAEQAADGSALQALTPKQYAVVTAAAEAIVVGVPVTPGAIATGIDRELAVAGEPMLSDMRTVLTILEHGSLLALRRRRFTALSVEDRRAVLDSWATSRFNLRRAAYQAVRSFVVFFAYADDRTRPVTGFEGPWPERLELPVYPVEFGEVRARSGQGQGQALSHAEARRRRGRNVI